MDNQQSAIGNQKSLLPYRENAAAVVVNASGLLLVGWKHDAWQLPQGGVHRTESPEHAVVRELAEEIGTTTFHVLKRAQHVHCYDWPPGGVTARKKRFRGQRQHYFLVAFDGTVADLHPETTGEFAKLDWQSPADVLAHAWELKRPGYEAAFREFGLI